MTCMFYYLLNIQYIVVIDTITRISLLLVVNVKIHLFAVMCNNYIIIIGVYLSFFEETPNHYLFK